jgi:hypothetical protein
MCTKWNGIVGLIFFGLLALPLAAQDGKSIDEQRTTDSTQSVWADGKAAPAPSGPPYCVWISQDQNGRFGGVVDPDPHGSLAATRFGFLREWFLGHGLVARVRVETAQFRLALPVDLHWYPMRGLDLSMGWDLVQQRFFGAAQWRF